MQVPIVQVEVLMANVQVPVVRVQVLVVRGQVLSLHRQVPIVQMPWKVGPVRAEGTPFAAAKSPGAVLRGIAVWPPRKPCKCSSSMILH